ncbi:glycosyltransferase family 39 protein [Candidatus Sumerlaeota bacterium]|nr:glycosyltransferase family 39 protein [Candidatus Sumerlaeota bacterium]
MGPSSSPQEPRYSPTLAASVLAFIVFATFALSLRNDFLYWDDNIYTFQESLVTDGSLGTFLRIFQSSHHGNYYPLTLVSFWIEYRIAGMTYAVYHLTNVILHVINAVICFRLLNRLCGNMSVAWLAALLFAVHPLRVEGVAWISSRKDLLAAMFYLFAMLGHVSMGRQGRISSGMIIFILHAAALMSKGTAVTLPVALLLIDYQQRRCFSPAVILEKVPLFILSVIFGLLAIRFQGEVGATASGLPQATLVERLSVASFAVLFYFGKVLVPIDLSAFYLYPLTPDFAFPGWLRIMPLIAVPLALGALFFLRRNRSAFFGLAFFFVAIGPVLQFLSVGAAIAADRYTYLPGVGLAFTVALLVTQSFRNGKAALLVMALALIIPTIHRITVWRDTESLMTNQIRNFPLSVFAWNDRGVARMARGREEDAFADYSVAVYLRPNDPDAKANIIRVRKLLDQREAPPLPP